jgi:hypothetical protein
MQTTENPKYICPLHVGECNGSILSKFQDFSAGLYPDSVTAIVETATAPVTAEKLKPKPKPAPKPVVKNDDDDEQEEEPEPEEEPEEVDAEETNVDDQEQGVDLDDITPMVCNVCDETVDAHPAGTWHDGWGCDWPGHEGENFCFSTSDPVYGCPTITQCNWGVCQTCYTNYMAEQKNEQQASGGAENVLNVPQPEGTKSAYNTAYYCEIKNVRFEMPPEGDDAEYLLMIVEYNVRGDMSLGSLQDPSTSTVLCGSSNVYSSHSIKVYFQDAFQNRGELIYQIPASEVTQFAEQPVRFVFGEGGYSEAKLVMPNANLENQEVTLPMCASGTHVMIMSDYAKGDYAPGYICEVCNEGKHGFRWFCLECCSDKCFSCEPLQVCPAAKCKKGNGEEHALERCSGTKYGGRRCDVCKRTQLQYDPEFYHCSEHNYDLCLICASKEQAAVQQQ